MKFAEVIAWFVIAVVILIGLSMVYRYSASDLRCSQIAYRGRHSGGGVYCKQWSLK